MTTPDHSTHHTKGEFDEHSPEYLRAVEFGDFVETMLEVRDKLNVIEQALRTNTAEIVDSFWRFGSSQIALNEIDPGPDNVVFQAREDVRADLKRAGNYYQSFERQHGDKAIAELRAICDELAAIHEAVTALIAGQPVAFEPAQIRRVFEQGRHLHGMAKKDALEAARTIGQPFKAEMKKVLELRKRFDALTQPPESSTTA